MLAEVAPIRATLDIYTKAFNFCCEYAWTHRLRNRVKLHEAIYKVIREKFSLPAQMAISVIGRAAETVNKVEKQAAQGQKVSCPQSKLCAFRLD